MKFLDKISNLTQPSYPSVKYPTIVEGEIFGPVRCESFGGYEMYLPEAPSGSTKFINFKPFEAPDPKNGQPRIWAVSNIQKKSKKGWLKTNPDCYYSWYAFKFQDKDPQGNFISGTEKVVYFRKPFSWRIDWAGTMVNGVLRNWIWTLGYFGLRYD